MVYFKVVLDTKRKKNDSIYSVVIRITHLRVSTTFSTGLRVSLNDWDENKGNVKPSASNSDLLNSQITGIHAKLQKAALRLVEEERFSFLELKSVLSATPQVKKLKTVNDFALQTINDLIEEGKAGNALVYKAAWSRLDKFNGERPLQFKQINLKFIQEFKRHLIAEGVKTNTISNYLRTIRALYNRAVKEEYVKEELYPFKHIKIESEPTLKRAVSFIDLKRLLNCETQIATTEWHSINYFFLSLSLIGISFTDLAYLKKTDIVDDRVIYIRRKTGKVYSIKLTPLATEILKHYTANNSKYLLPLLKDSTVEDSLSAHKIIKQWIKTTNHHLGKLSAYLKMPKVTTYVARHSWATTAKRNGYSNELIAEALGHEYGNRITSVYLDSYGNEVIDNLNEMLLKLLV